MLIGLLTTLVIEAAMLTLLRAGRPALVLSVFLNILTQPAFSFWMQWMLPAPHASYWSLFVTGEMGVGMAESFGYKAGLKCSWGRAFGLSVAANAASAGLGLFLPL